MNLRDQLSGLFWLAISIFVCVVAIRTGIGTFGTPGPGFLLFWLAVILGALSIILVIASFLRKEKEGKLRDLWKGMKWSKVILVISFILVYSYALTRIGYLIATCGLMVLLFGIAEKQRVWITVVSAFITALVSYIIFHIWLDVQLPRGILSF